MGRLRIFAVLSLAWYACDWALPGALFAHGELFGVPEARGDGVSGDHGAPLRRLLRKGGVFAKVAPGIHALLPVGRKIVARLERVLRVEMARLHTHELELPILQPERLIRSREAEFGRDLYKLKDRQDRVLHLSPTCEELACLVACNALSPLSRTRLPLRVFQIRSKFRDELRPCDATMRCREFTMKDAYSFHADEQSSEAAYEEFREGYKRILQKLRIAHTIRREDRGDCFDEEFDAELPATGDSSKLEIAHIFKLGTALCEEAGLSYEVEGRRKKPVHLNSYGIGIQRLLYAAAAQHSDADGLKLPQIMAPYDVAVVPCDTDSAEVAQLAHDLHVSLSKAGLDTLLDNRDLPLKQRTADLRAIGVPHVVYVSESTQVGGTREPSGAVAEAIRQESRTSNEYHLGQSESALLARSWPNVDTSRLDKPVRYVHRAFEGDFVLPAARLLELLCA
ncbi:tRNA synthetase class II core domain containing protein, putative [Babesia bigemina]|uniref:proline--tRNA ligase n=1 Tax=Babesia bigemina TaxID=5866 RepID=A0A061CYS5_BABBI|nr:tRNA synthetase class II core domain containing protein, putative [Babesia bigemina]CDR93771.1 tRNA synthetase class II core domain containing protein, putative [Babesia bigemina]|eukprot:XP_012765957.1 tRNA synthetase class II core domain containing protein, putative [Babesia bigemina]